jgi:phosphoribosylformylglycinamidine synthase
MGAVTAFAASGGPVLGICNGFQILCEAGLLPGALQKNRGLRFVCSTVPVRVESERTSVTSGLASGSVLRLPVNHFEGCYTCPPEVMTALEAEERVVFRYVENPNGSLHDVAGVCNEARNVVGLMPHPERACHELLGSTDGRSVLAGLLGAAARR